MPAWAPTILSLTACVADRAWTGGRMRRHAAMHRRKAIENPLQVPTLAEHAWGLTASDYHKGYQITVSIRLRSTCPAREGVDYPEEPGHDNYGDGTIAPYAGSTIMFDPKPAIAAAGTTARCAIAGWINARLEGSRDRRLWLPRRVQSRQGRRGGVGRA